MDLGDHNNASMSIPMKRRRGRPRKYPILHTVENSQPEQDPNSTSRENVSLQRTQVNHEENDSVPPGFETVNGNQTWQGSNQGVNDIMVGQVVSGVVEAVFDAGCLLTVRVGNTQTILRGVVLRPGHYVPVSAENDVAPNVQMIRRKEIPLPMVNSAQVPCQTSEVKEKNLQFTTHRNGTANRPIIPETTTPDVNPSVSKSTYTPPMTQAATLSNAGGNATPAVTQAIYFPNTVSLSSQLSQVVSQTAVTTHPTTLGNQAASFLHPSNAIASTTDQPTAADRSWQTQTSLQKTLEGIPNDKGVFSHPEETHRMSFQNLLTEVMKRVESPSQGVDTPAEVCMSVSKTPAHHFSDTHENEHNQPLQAVESGHHNYSAAVPSSSSSQDNRTDKMSELLRVLQENFDGSKNLEAQEPNAGCSSKSDERGPDTQFGDQPDK